MNKKKLVLFDIDGTLIRHVGDSDYSKRVQYAARIAYNINVSDVDISNFRGSVDKDTAWSILSPSGISYSQFEKKFDAFSTAMYDYLVFKAKTETLYQKIDDAETLARKLKNIPHIALGLMTGNVKTIGYWKLDHAGLGGLFSFGIFGDQANDRIELAQMVPHESLVYFGRHFRPDEIYVLGDTIYDVRCAKAIGARSIAVTTGRHGLRSDLEKESPDLVVDSLMDERVLKLLL